MRTGNRHFLGFISLAAALLSVAPAIGQSWAPGSSGTTESLNASWFVDGRNGWIVGDAGSFRSTTDGGVTWAPIQLTNDDLQDVAFRHATLGLVVGDNGRIHRTVNGTTWAPVASGTNINLAAVAWGGDGRAFAAGRDGVILRSQDDGLTWTTVETGADRYRDATAFGTRAWLVGDEGVVRATADGGVTWFDQSSGTASDLKGVSFVSETTGWIAGQNNTLLYTDDGGATWTSRSNGIIAGLDSVFFGNASRGWGVGNNGVVFATINGGLNWVAESSGTTVALGHVFFANAFHGSAVGDNGALVLRTALAVDVSLEPDAIHWGDVDGAVAYDVIEGDLDLLRDGAGDFALSTSGCLADDAVASPVALGPDPLPGQALWFLIRPEEAGGSGSYDSGSFDQHGTRDAGVGLSGLGCP